jgi:HEAT repeats
MKNRIFTCAILTLFFTPGLVVAQSLSDQFLFQCPFILGQSSRTLSQTTPDKNLEEAIATLRHINQDGLTEAQKELKAGQIDNAWKIISASGEKGLSRLKQEVQKVDSNKEKDDFFKLNASALLWQIGRLTEADNIARIWNSTPLAAQYRYVFYVAFDAALTHDPRAIPMLKAILKDDKGSIYVDLHAMDVEWPLSHEFIWGAYGPKGLPVLHDVLETSNDPVEVRSAMTLLSQAQYLPALPRIRQAVTSKQEEVRHVAIQSLGRYGRPQDYDLLISGLRSNDLKEIWRYVYALYEYDDVRAVPYLIPLLETKDDHLRSEVIAALSHLLTPVSFEALKKQAATTVKPEEKALCEQFINDTAKNLPSDYFKKPVKEREALLAEARNSRYFLKRGEQTLTRSQLLEASNEWMSNNRLDKGKYAWVEEKHILSAATTNDIDLLLEIKASLYARLSDECLYEVRRLDEVVKQLGRSRYRKAIGINEKAEEK